MMMDAQHIDQNVLNTLLDSVGGDQEFLKELVETFFEDAPGQFTNLHEGLENGNAEVFRRAAHSLKSNSASFGAMHLSQLCKQLEEIGKSGELLSAAPLIAKAELEYAQVRTELEEITHGQ